MFPAPRPGFPAHSSTFSVHPLHARPVLVSLRWPHFRAGTEARQPGTLLWRKAQLDSNLACVALITALLTPFSAVPGVSLRPSCDRDLVTVPVRWSWGLVSQPPPPVGQEGRGSCRRCSVSDSCPHISLPTASCSTAAWTPVHSAWRRAGAPACSPCSACGTVPSTCWLACRTGPLLPTLGPVVRTRAGGRVLGGNPGCRSCSEPTGGSPRTAGQGEACI